MRKAITLIEIIVTLVVASVLSIGMFQALEAVAIISQKAKIRTNHSLDTQSAIDQISLLMYDRVPNSVVGYNPTSGIIKPFNELINGDDIKVLQWIGTFSEAQKKAYYSGFVDMNASSKPRLSAPDTNRTGIRNLLDEKWGSTSFTQLSLVFAGAFDAGVTQNRYGWNGSGSEDALKITNLTNTNIILTNPNNATYIYEKYYLADSAYAVARGIDINSTVDCITDLHVRDVNNTLFLFYNFRPWDGERFCADKNGGVSRSGRATVLAEDIKSFRVEIVNGLYRISIETNASVNGSKVPVRVSKQKVVF